MNPKLPLDGRIYTLTVGTESASPVRLVRSWPDHFSAGRWSRAQPQRQSEDETIGQVSHASSPLQCVYAFLVIVPTLLPADQEPGVK